MLEKLAAAGTDIYKTVSRFATTTSIRISRHRPEILIGASIIVGGFAVYEICKATYNNLNDVVEETEDALEAVKTKEIENAIGTRKFDEKQAMKARMRIRLIFLKKLWTTYWKGIVFGLLSILLNLSAHNILMKENLALASSIAAYDTYIREYRRRVASAVGDEIESKLYFDLQDNEVEVETPMVDEEGNPIFNGNGEQKFEKETINAKTIRPDIPYSFMFNKDTSIAFRGDLEVDETMMLIAEEEMNRRLEFRRTNTEPGFVFGDELLDFVRINPKKAKINLVAWRNAVWYLPPKNETGVAAGDIHHISLGLGDIYDRAKRSIDADQNGYNGILVVPNFDGVVSDYKDIF